VRNNALAVALMAAASALSIQTTQDKGLRLEFTAEDRGVFIKPWSATIKYGRNRCGSGMSSASDARHDSRIPTAMTNRPWRHLPGPSDWQD
jgi:hypothetical protein